MPKMEFWKAIKLYDLGRIERKVRVTTYSYGTIFYLGENRLFLREHLDEGNNVIRVDLWDMCPPSEGEVLRASKGSFPSHEALNIAVLADGWLNLEAGDIPFYPEDFAEDGSPTFTVRV